MSGPLSDQTARQAITDKLDETLFVEASAGSGKTTQLVARLVNLLATEGAAIEEVAAITFTEAAAAELRDRLGEELERRAADDPDCPAARAAAGLESAAVTTLHGFARRILAEHPLEAGLPPVFEVLDGFQSLVDFDERWAELVDRLLADPDDARALQVAAACRVGTNVLREIAQKFEDNWDLLPAGPAPPIPPPQVDVSAVLRPLQEAFALADRCTDPGDRLLDHLAALGPWAERLASCTGELEALGVMARLGKTKLSSGSGRKENWGGLKESVTDLPARRPVGSRSERGRRRAGRAGAVGVGHRSTHPAVGRAAAGRRAPALPRSVGAGPGPRERRPRRPAGAPRPVPVPPDRRVPGHRSHPGRAGGAHRLARERSPTGGRCPSARAACSSLATPSSRSTASGGPTSRSSRS